jgi:translation elongation factor P/translation initiation factor 5A
MVKKKYFELKVGDKIISFGEHLTIRKMEFSGQGIKQGRSKVRVEAENNKGEIKIIIRLSGDLVEAG